jgi:hypothetical protein
MTRGELRGWSYALAVARLLRDGGDFDYDTGEVTAPPKRTEDAEA